VTGLSQDSGLVAGMGQELLKVWDGKLDGSGVDIGVDEDVVIGHQFGVDNKLNSVIGVIDQTQGGNRPRRETE